MKRITFAFLSCCILFACDTNDSILQEPQNDNFYALTVGNSWVYKNYRYNINTQEYEDTGVVDSVSIVSVETIENVDYFKFRRYTSGNEQGLTLCNPNGEYFEYLRENEGNLIWDDGRVKFTNSDYSERILNTNPDFSLREILIEGETELNIEAGTFNCINSERYVIVNGETAPARDKFYYADGYGLVYDTSSFASQQIPTIIRRLDSFVIQ